MKFKWYQKNMKHTIWISHMTINEGKDWDPNSGESFISCLPFTLRLQRPGE